MRWLCTNKKATKSSATGENGGGRGGGGERGEEGVGDNKLDWCRGRPDT